MKLDLRFATENEKEILKNKSKDPLLVRGRSIIKRMVKGRRLLARLAYISVHGGSMSGRMSKEAEKGILKYAKENLRTLKAKIKI